MNRRTLLAHINKFDEKSSVLSAYKKACAEQGHVGKTVWYTSQKQHWQEWLKEYTGEGAYNRKNWDRDARFIYNHVNCPGMLLWLADASGVQKSLVTKAKNNALAVNDESKPTRCRNIRQVLSWEMVESALKDN